MMADSTLVEVGERGGDVCVACGDAVGVVSVSFLAPALLVIGVLLMSIDFGVVW